MRGLLYSDMTPWLLEFLGLIRPDVRRDDVIRRRYTAGETLSDLARAYGLSPQRVYQIVHGRQH